MNRKDSLFGAEPDRIREMIRSGMDVDEIEVEDNIQTDTPVSALMERPGTRIGCYKLLRVLGEGGMGMVYLAEQVQLIRRRVALKIIKPGMDSQRILARFEAERQALALLDHPNIAQVFDAGTAESGRPFFVMEYVKGSTITAFCDRHHLPVEKRLHLFQQVCLALQHAHQKGIIHRDIKPSNILVSSENDRAMPKIIDFGVAKAISQPLTERTLVTEESQLIGTPEYMSPEQVELANDDIDTRSDIYSLGVLLYELLTGVLPFDPQEFRENGIERIRHMIRETDPKTPSTRLTRLGDEARKVAENRSTEIAALARCLHRELEWIPLKAMRKERSDRYRSASEMADDIENYLKGDPLMAGPLTTGYHLRKFLRRHKALVSGIAAVLLVSVIGAIVSMHFALGQASARAQQTNLLAEYKAMSTFLSKDILKPLAGAKMQDATIREVLDNALEQLGSRFADYPHREAEMRVWFGSMYHWQFSDLGVALTSLERAVQLSGRGHFMVSELALVYCAVGRYQDAEAMFKTIIKSMEERGPQEKYISYYYHVKSNLGDTYRLLGRYDEAERCLRNVLHVAPWDKESVLSMECSYKLIDVLIDEGRYTEAIQISESSVQIGHSLQNKSTPNRRIIIVTLRAMCQLGILHTLEGDLEKAKSLLEEALKEAESVCGQDSSHTVGIKIALAVLHTKQGDYDEAEKLLGDSLINLQARLDDDYPELLKTKSHLGVLYRDWGRHDKAETLLSDTVQRQSEIFGVDHPDTLTSKHELGVLHLAQSQYDKAEPLLQAAFQGRAVKLGPEHPHTVETLNQLVKLYEAWDKPDEAKTWRAKLAE
jgi:eukaryotic-like serine/threonine-protein kinase